jgi:hypothetical protein
MIRDGIQILGIGSGQITHLPDFWPVDLPLYKSQATKALVFAYAAYTGLYQARIF